jgi:hypothetical protein
MGAVTGLLGIGGQGASFQAQNANITNPLQQAAAQNAQANNAANLLSQTAGQVVPTTAMGVANQAQQYQQMQQLAQQLGQQAQGAGPNPALAQLAQTTGQNVAQQGALMAGQRGASANPALIARQASQQGAAVQQQAAGQAATLSAQQQLAAEQALQQQQGALSNLATTQVGQGLNAASSAEQGQLANAQNIAGQTASLNQSNVQNVQQANSANAGIQGQSAAAGGKSIGSLLFAGGGDVSASGGSAPMPSAPGVGQSFVNRFLQGGNTNNSQAGTGILGGLIKSGISNVFNSSPSPSPNDSDTGAQSRPDAANAVTGGSDSALAALAGGGDVLSQARDYSKSAVKPKDIKDVAFELGRMQTTLSPDWSPKGGGWDRSLETDPDMMPQKKAKGGSIDMRSSGGHVPGTAKVKGDSYANDTVDAKLSPKEIVIPRSVTMSKDPVGNSAKFVAAVLARRNRR